MTDMIQERRTRTKETWTIKQPYGKLIVDDWEPVAPSGAAPVLLVHGWGGTGTYWRDVAIALSETVRVIVPDLPGTGRSQPVKSARDMFDQVDVLVDILNILELDRVQIVGHSMGGAMSVLLAEKHPDPIERMVLTSLTFFKTEEQKRIYRNVMRSFRMTMRMRAKWMASVPGSVNAMAQHYFYQVPKNNPMLKQGMLDYLELDGPTALACADDATDEAIPAAGAILQMPVLLVACRNDKMMPLENVDYTQNIIEDCQVRWIEECGHLPMIEKRDEYIAILRDFLSL